MENGHTDALSVIASAITGPISRDRIASAKESVLKDETIVVQERDEEGN